MPDTNEEEVTSGLLTFSVNGETRTVPELKRTANRAWQDGLGPLFAAGSGIPVLTLEGQQAMADAACGAVLAYDATHALGDLEDATESEIEAIYNRLQEVSFPLAKNPLTVAMAIVQAGAASALASSTSGPSPTGTTAAPTILTDHLPSAKSSSSTRRRRNA